MLLANRFLKNVFRDFQKSKKKKKDRKKEHRGEKDGKLKRKSGYIETEGITTPSKESLPSVQTPLPVSVSSALLSQFHLPTRCKSLSPVVHFVVSFNFTLPF